MKLILLVMGVVFHCPPPVHNGGNVNAFPLVPGPNYAARDSSEGSGPPEFGAHQGQLVPDLLSKKRWFWPWVLGLGVAASGFVSFFIAYCYGWEKFRSFSENPTFRLFTSFFCTGTGFLAGVALFELIGFKGFGRLVNPNEPIASRNGINHQTLIDEPFGEDDIVRPLGASRSQAQARYDDQRRIPLWLYIVTGISSCAFLAYSLAFWVSWGLSKPFVYNYVFGLFFFLFCINGGLWAGWLLKNFLSNRAYRP